jgi:hypothetical protein
MKIINNKRQKKKTKHPVMHPEKKHNPSPDKYYSYNLFLYENISGSSRDLEEYLHEHVSYLC